MWKRKKKHPESKEAEETSSTKEEQKTNEVCEKAPSPESEQQVGETVEILPSKEEEQRTNRVAEELYLNKEDYQQGVFIFGKKIEGGFKKFLTALFTIFILPPAIIFGLLVLTSIVMLAFPLIFFALPIILLALCIILIALPVITPLVTVLTLITGRGKVHFGLKNKKFALKLMGLTFPPHAGR